MMELFEKIKKNKPFIIFIISVFLFILALFYLLSIYVNVNNNNNLEESSIEVSLPVINWQKYSNLSKRYPNDIIFSR